MYLPAINAGLMWAGSIRAFLDEAPIVALIGIAIGVYDIVKAYKTRG